MQRRLEELESKREQQERVEQRVWLDSLSDVELDALCADLDPVMKAAVEALSDVDLDRLINGKMPTAEWEVHRRQAQEQRSVS